MTLRISGWCIRTATGRFTAAVRLLGYVDCLSRVPGDWYARFCGEGVIAISSPYPTSYFSETHGTIFHGKRASVELIVRVIACLAEGLGIRGTARVFEIDPNTVLGWLVEAAEQLKAFSTYFLHELHLNQIQLDELYAVLSAVRDGDISEAEAIERLSQSPPWVWTAIDPESKLLLSAQVGERTLALAQAVLHQIAQLLAPGCVPLFLSDGYPHYLTAIVTHFGHWVQPPRRQATGPV